MQVRQMRKRPTINMESRMLVKLMEKVGPGQTKFIRSNLKMMNQMKNRMINLKWKLKTSAAGKIQDIEL